MNLKAYFSPILAISLLLMLSACASRNQSSSVPVLPDVTTSSPANEGLDVVTETDNSVNSDVQAVSGTQLPLVSEGDRRADIFERMRRGFQFPELKSKHISQYEKWNSEHDTYLDALFTRGTPFLFHIVEEIEKRQLPMELALLPAVESAFKPSAVSHSKADGLWQFIPSTGRHFGLRQDWWYDGRRDVLSSTTAALDYLTQLNKMFDGDWFLTLAAYNAGPGTVSRAIKSNKAKGRGTLYQNLSLRSETKRYIPKLIALKNIINNPHAFNVDLPVIESKPYFRVVELGGQIDLKKFADDAGIKQSELRHLNAGFKRWATSPEGPHRLLIPINAQGDIEHAKQAALRAPQLSYSSHKIAQGDSLSSIARRYGVSVNALKTSNNLTGTKIRAGKNLMIPVRASQTARAQDSISQGSKIESSALNKRVVHHVRRGDTLWSIARKYQVKVNNLVSWNNISRNQILQLNQALFVMTN